MHFAALRVTYAGFDKREYSAAWPLRIAIPFLASRLSCRIHRAAGDRSHHSSRRLLVRPGIMGIGQGEVQAVEQKPTGTISGQSVSDAQGYTTRGLTLAKSGKSEEALAELTARSRLDPYNVQALCTDAA